MQIREVRSRKDWADFFRVPGLIYQSDSHYIPHLKQDIQRILNPVNPALKGGGLEVWVLEDGGSVIGRIAAFYSEDKPKAGIGFFECIDDSQASRMLFEAAINFLRTSSKDIVQGPVNAGERDQYWGLMVKGFTSPAYQENYNPPYYQLSPPVKVPVHVPEPLIDIGKAHIEGNRFPLKIGKPNQVLPNHRLHGFH